MKTLTEFATPTLKNAHAKKQELTAAGKTAEELPAALGEALKIEGDKLTYLLAALELVGEKTHDLKRVVVSSLAEGEKAPSSAKLVGEKYYTVEHYAPINKGGPREDARGGRDKGRRDGKGGKGGKRGEGRGGRRGEGRGGEGRSAEGGAGRGGEGGGGGERGERGGRGPRGPKPVGQAVGGKPAVLPLPIPNKTAAQPGPKPEASGGASGSEEKQS